MDPCPEWLLKKTINPVTKRNIKINGPVYNKLKKLCDKKEITKLPVIDSDCMKYQDITLKSHQKKVIDFMKNTSQKGLILYHSTGSGKTLSAITIARCLLGKSGIKKIIILTPVSVKKQWESQFDKPELIKLLNFVTIESHEKWLKLYSTNKTSSKNSILIIDEAHKFRTMIKENDIKKRSKIMINAAFDAKKVLFLTATPMVNYLSDLYNMIIVLNNKKWSKDNYEKIEEQLNENIKCKFSNYKNKDNNDDFPNSVFMRKEFTMDQEYYKQYMNIEKSIVGNISFKMFKNTKLKPFYNGIRRAINLLDEKIESTKIKWLKEQILSNCSKKSKSIIYSNWLEAGVNHIKTFLNKNNIKWGNVSGNVSDKKRREIVQDYNNNKIWVILITSAGSEGLDLKATKNIYIMEPHWNDTRITQVIGRGVRYASHKHLPLDQQKVHIYQLILSKPKGTKDSMPSADDIMCILSNNKQEKLDQLYMDIVNLSIENPENHCK